MPEVIDLISSPFENLTRPKKAPSIQVGTRSPSADVVGVDYGLSPFSDGLGLPPLGRKKKRRLSDPATTPGASKSAPRFSFLSSDDDVLFGEELDDSKPSAKKNTTQIAELPSDPFTFSSSAPEPRTVRRATKSTTIDLEAENSDVEELPSFSQPVAPTRTYLSKKTSNLLASITAAEKEGEKTKRPRHEAKSKTTCTSPVPAKNCHRTIEKENIPPLSPPHRTLAQAKTVVGAEGTARRPKKALTDAEKEADKERKRLAKEEKVREKQWLADMAEVNRSKIDKKNSTREMLIDMTRTLEGTSVGNQVLEFMKLLEVEATFCDDLTTQKGHLIRWRRRVRAKYNEEGGHWEPLPTEKIEAEKHILLHITAQDFLEIATAGVFAGQEPAAQEKAMTRNLDNHVTNLKSRYKDCKPIYLIEGLDNLLRKNKSAKNRAYTAAVRSQMAENEEGNPSTNRPQGRRKKVNNNNTNTTTTTTLLPINLSTIDSSLTETLLLHLQLRHSLLLHHTPNPNQSSHWIRTFTEHISTIPYRHARMHTNDSVTFCMDVGQIKSGTDRADTFLRMLQEVQRVTPSMAHGIANHCCPTGVGDLIGAFRAGGPLALQDVRKSLNRDGAISERVLGPAVSKRLYRVWMGREEGEGV